MTESSFGRRSACPPHEINLSGVNGRLDGRLPVASKIAFSIAAPTPTMPSSPMPLAPVGAKSLSNSSIRGADVRSVSGRAFG
jgi:hypothetical protein